MKRNEIKELAKKTGAELKTALAEAQKKLLQKKLEAKARKIKNGRMLARLRDDIARILTILTEKEKKI